MTEYTLLREHTHNGKQLIAGARISVTPQQAAWLDSLGVISLDGTAKPRTPMPALLAPKPVTPPRCCGWK